MTAGSEKDEYDGDAADDVAIAGCGPLSPPPSIVDPGYLSIRMLFVSLLTFCKRTPTPDLLSPCCCCASLTQVG